MELQSGETELKKRRSDQIPLHRNGLGMGELHLREIEDIRPRETEEHSTARRSLCYEKKNGNLRKKSGSHERNHRGGKPFCVETRPSSTQGGGGRRVG